MKKVFGTRKRRQRTFSRFFQAVIYDIHDIQVDWNDDIVNASRSSTSFTMENGDFEGWYVARSRDPRSEMKSTLRSVSFCASSSIQFHSGR